MQISLLQNPRLAQDCNWLFMIEELFDVSEKKTETILSEGMRNEDEVCEVDCFVILSDMLPTFIQLMWPGTDPSQDAPPY